MSTAWWDDEWLVYDVETTGLDTREAHVVQLGLLRVRNGQVVDRRDVLCNPGVSIPSDATKIHGITDAMVRDAMPEDEALQRFTDMVSGWPGALVTYNGMGYDDLVLDARTGGKFSQAMAGKARIDVLVLVRMDGVGKWWPGKGRHKLSSMAGRFRLELTDEDRLHWATTDCVLTAQVLHTLLTDPAYSEVVKRLPPGPSVTGNLLSLVEANERDFQRWKRRQPKWEDG